MKSNSFFLIMLGLLFFSIPADAQRDRVCPPDKIMVYKGGIGCGCGCRKKCIDPAELQNYLDNGYTTWGCVPCCWVQACDVEYSRTTTSFLEVHTLVNGDLLAVAFTLAEEDDVTIQITDMAGKQVAIVAEEYFGDPENELLWDSSGLRPGMYMITMETGTSMDAKVLTIY